MNLENGRPGDAAGRESREMRCYDLLDGLGVAYTRADHESAMTMADCRELLDCSICKNLFLCNRQKTAFYLLMTPGDKPFHTKDLSAALGVSRLSFAPEEAMEELLDLMPGSVSVLGLMNDREKRVSLVIDAEVLAAEYVGCHPCKNTSSLKLRTRDLTEKILPAMGHGYTIVELARYD
jgi:Ala-tRNA(Pro) deacylase